MPDITFAHQHARAERAEVGLRPFGRHIEQGVEDRTPQCSVPIALQIGTRLPTGSCFCDLHVLRMQKEMSALRRRGPSQQT